MMTKAQAKELREMTTKYPKAAIAGHKLELDAEWKKIYVAIRALAIINIDITMKAGKLIDQVSEETNEAMDKQATIEFNTNTKKELEVCLRCKNLFRATEILQVNAAKLTGMINKDTIEKDIYAVLIGVKSNLTAVVDENQKQAQDIDSTLAICWKEAIAQGLNLTELERNTLIGMDTKGDIERLIAITYRSLNLNMVN